MSLREVYLAAYQAQKRFTQEGARSNGSLRIIVGHLAYLQALRTQIEYMNAQEASRRLLLTQDAIHPYFRSSPITKHSGRTQSLPRPPPEEQDEEDSDEDDGDEDRLNDEDDTFEYDGDEDADLGVMRPQSRDSFARPPPDLDACNGSSSEDDSDSDAEEERELLQALIVRLYEVDMGMMSEQTKEKAATTQHRDSVPEPLVTMRTWDERECPLIA